MGYFVTEKNILRDNELFIIDLDGVVYEGNISIVNAVDSISKLCSNGKKIAYFTNNATLTPESYRNKLARMGIIAEASQIYTSAMVCARSLRGIHKEGKTVFVVGEDGLFNALAGADFSILNDNHECDEIIKNKTIKADLVVVGLDRSITYKKLAAASLLISRRAKFYASNTDATLPDPSGFLPGAGSIVAFLTTASGSKPDKIFGKPYPEGIYQILKAFSCSPCRAVMVGDRLDTDILCGKNAKINTAIVLTGVTQKKDVQKLSKPHMPDYVLNDLSEIFK
jgi:4-nitrophenyl phosphatase